MGFTKRHYHQQTTQNDPLPPKTTHYRQQIIHNHQTENHSLQPRKIPQRPTATIYHQLTVHNDQPLHTQNPTVTNNHPLPATTIHKRLLLPRTTN